MSAPGLKITNPYYSNVTFAPNVYQEYPKWIHMPGYKSVMVETREEEDVLRARPPVDKLAAPVLTEAFKQFKPENVHLAPTPAPNLVHDERSILFQVGKEHGIKIDRRWSTVRIRQELEKAKK